MTIETAVVQTPLGPVTLYANGSALVGLEFTDRAARRAALERKLQRHLGRFETREVPDPAGARSRLEAYFAGERHALSGQKVELHGTPFQLAVWRELRRIPPGNAAAARVRPGAARTPKEREYRSAGSGYFFFVASVRAVKSAMTAASVSG